MKELLIDGTAVPPLLFQKEYEAEKFHQLHELGFCFASVSTLLSRKNI